MSITAETAKAHANDPAVLCCRAEGGITIQAANLEDPAIFDDLVDSGLLKLDGTLTIEQVLGAKLVKTCDSLTPLTADLVEGAKAPAAEEAPAEEAKEEGREKGRQEGREEGRQEGRQEGREEGKKEGEKLAKINLVIKKVKRGKPLSIIASELEEEEDDMKPMYDAVTASAPEYNIDEIKENLKTN